ncbi:MAG: hypothetical protein WBQ68_06190, partial [Terriglobales bacterium]
VNNMENVQIQRAGRFYKARWCGSANFVFGETSAQALERLKKSPRLSLRDTPSNLKRRESNWATGFRAGKP